MSWSQRIEAALPRAREVVAAQGGGDPRGLLLRCMVGEVLQGEAEDFLAWARDDPAWSLVVAECTTQVCAKPAEAAAFILAEGLCQQLVDEGLLEDDDD